MNMLWGRPEFRKTAAIFSVPFLLLGGALLWAFLKVDEAYRVLVRSEAPVAWVFQQQGLDGVVEAFGDFALLCAFVAAFGALASWAPRPWALRAIRKCLFAFYLPALFLGLIVLKGTYLISLHDLVYAGERADVVNVFYWRWAWLLPLALTVLFAGFLHLTAWRRTVMDLYEAGDSRERERGRMGERAGNNKILEAHGDRFFENLRAHGRDPQNRHSMIRSIVLHIFVLIILPWLFGLFSWVTPSKLPDGSGDTEVPPVTVVVRPPQKIKSIIVNPDSPFDFNFPKIEDLQKEVDVDTQLIYVAQNRQIAKGGPLGQGGPGKGGWPDGTGDGLIRFIRLQYRGDGWNDGMDRAAGADINFLQAFRKLTGFNVAQEGEAHGISLLSSYPKGFAPPFVYMTGRASIATSRDERHALREYLQDGGMLFADCGGSAWHASFRNFMGSVLPDYRLVQIGDDDTIFRQPFLFSGGAPPLWHHGGNDALGVKHGDRWVVFYHPGDLNDAWKSGGSGLDDDKVEASFQMGFNVLYYAITRYLEQTKGHRK